MTVINLTIVVRSDSTNQVEGEEENAHTLKSLLLQMLSTGGRDEMIKNISLTIDNT